MGICNHCETMKELKEEYCKTVRPWFTIEDQRTGQKIRGTAERWPKCPKCRSEISSTRMTTPGFYSKEGKMNKELTHKHACQSCKWESEIKEGDYE